MNQRRTFIKTFALAGGTLGLAKVAGLRAETPAKTAAPAPYWAYDKTNVAAIRPYWCDIAKRLSTPVLEALSKRQLKATMPVEPKGTMQREVTYLEALGRLLDGIAPWIELPADDTPEGRERARFAALAREAIDAGTDPKSPDYMHFGAAKVRQPLVDSAFLAQAMLRAPRELWEKLDSRVKTNVIAALKQSRSVGASVRNNWALFAAMVETFLHRRGEKRDETRLFRALTLFREWYAGDGWYGDGASFHMDYYNSFVIHPMLVEILDVVGDEAPEWKTLRDSANARLTRYAETQERFVAPDGSYPAVGRSIIYRGGAFQALALAALRKQLRGKHAPAQARTALTSVMRRTLEAPGTFDESGWLQIGLSGRQPRMGEKYISTGSLYMASLALLPLGLPPADTFWTSPHAPGTWENAWGGANIHADSALRGEHGDRWMAKA
ncbi:hypothetical protein M2447_002019 [Ereboglobus sp. PH5-10]|uniref:DUF2264 domain-containing protein n=1 Tax=Ereboglobus sp. PH5-10 TaxID=2940629 RepID=UPI002406B8B7|nr:DUF2264 domain-containing protein [Ereboglobus sp. PH5-10]MDF9827914.1 hypothetical protein [Ereboglobus sp. PH5-10]